MLWHEQTWPTIQKLDKELPVLVPLGSLEQHGHHLPLFVDSIQVGRIAERVEQRMKEKILLLPTQWLGSSEHHRDFPGTLSLGPSLYGQMLKSMARGIVSAGFRRIFFLNGHGGNEAPATSALNELVGESDEADNTYLVFSNWWQVARDSITADKLDLQSPAISHACEYETSLMLALRPELVDRPSDAKPVLSTPWFSSDYGGKVRVFHRYHRFTASGSMGCPSVATADKGHALLEAVVNDVCLFLNDFAQWPALPAIGPDGPPAGPK